VEDVNKKLAETGCRWRFSDREELAKVTAGLGIPQ
jgi:hypothetical protein